MSDRVIAYSYEADHHCPGCTFNRFGQDEHGFIPENAEDNEGNPIHAIFSWTEWWNSTPEAETLVCSDCGDEIDSTDAVVDGDYEAVATDAYEESALWTDEPMLSEQWAKMGNEPYSSGPGEFNPFGQPWELSEDARREMASDVRDFLDDVKNLVVGKLDPAQVGQDFWLTRNGHGAGFWDRGLGELGEELTKRCKPYGEASLYLGDNGEVEYYS